MRSAIVVFWCFFVGGFVAAATTAPLSYGDIIRALGFTPVNQAVIGQPNGIAPLDNLGGIQNLRLDGNASGGSRVALPISGCGTGATATGSAQVLFVVPGTSTTTSCGPIVLPGNWPNSPACVAVSTGSAQPVGLNQTSVNSGSVTFVSPTVFIVPFTAHCWG